MGESTGICLHAFYSEEGPACVWPLQVNHVFCFPDAAYGIVDQKKNAGMLALRKLNNFKKFSPDNVTALNNHVLCKGESDVTHSARGSI